jgi:hypothetical protein
MPKLNWEALVQDLVAQANAEVDEWNRKYAEPYRRAGWEPFKLTLEDYLKDEEPGT